MMNDVYFTSFGSTNFIIYHGIRHRSFLHSACPNTVLVGLGFSDFFASKKIREAQTALELHVGVLFLDISIEVARSKDITYWSFQGSPI